MRRHLHLAIPILLTASCLAFAARAQTQSNVTLYGVLDTGIESFNHSTRNGGTTTRMTTLSSSVPSLFGVRGSENLGDGLTAHFVLENGFAPGQGTRLQGGRLFGRQSTLGLRGSWGQVDFGRQWTTTFRAVIDADIIGPAAFSMASLDSYIPNARVDNSVSYYGSFDGLTVGAVYSMGRDRARPGNCGGEQGGSGCEGWSALLKHNAPQWGVAAAYDEIRGGSGATPITVVPGAPGVAFSHSGDRDRRYYLNGYLKTTRLRIGGGWIHRSIETETRALRTNLYYLGARLPARNLTFDGQISLMDNPSYDSRAALLVLRASYAFSKRTTAYVSAAYIHNSGDGPAYSVSASSLEVKAPRPGQSQIGTLAGLRHAF